MPGSREEDCLRNTQILHFFTPKLPPPPFLVGGGHEFTNVCRLTLQMLQTKFG